MSVTAKPVAARPWVAALLGFIFPGAGHVYAGRTREGVLWALLPDAFLLSGLGLALALPLLSVSIVWLRVIPYVVVRLVQVAAAWAAARRATAPSRTWVTVLFVALTWVGGSVVSTVMRELAIESFKTQSASMEPSLATGDQFFVFKAGPGARLSHGAIVTWHNRRVGKVFVNRIVAFGGETVDVEGGQLRVSGRAVTTEPCEPPSLVYLVSFDGLTREERGQCFVERDGDTERRVLHREHAGGRGDGHWEVPQGTVFVLGDNREDSIDSRFDGPVPVEDVVGRAWSVWLSFPPDSWVPRWQRIGAQL